MGPLRDLFLLVIQAARSHKVPRTPRPPRLLRTFSRPIYLCGHFEARVFGRDICRRHRHAWMPPERYDLGEAGSTRNTSSVAMADLALHQVALNKRRIIQQAGPRPGFTTKRTGLHHRHCRSIPAFSRSQ